jgi:hypothetical protein
MTIYRGPGGGSDATNDATVSQVQTLASQAANSATNAANSATSAASSASGASTSAAQAATSASNASSSASNASSSASSAASSAISAQNSQFSAAGSAVTSLNRSIESASSASSAAASATNAANSAAAAANSATAAGVSATNAQTAYNNTLAIYGDTTAVASAVSAASNSASQASTSASNASTSATNSASSASASATSAAAALSSQSQAAVSASNAAVSATNAATSATQAAASYDSFDDRYLGSKASDPTQDNDGGTLLTGALYWNSTTNQMRVYNGGTWVVSYVAPTDVVITNQTQTLTNKTISVDDNTVSGVAASSFVLSNASGNIDGSAAQKAIPTGVVVGTTDTQTLTNKTLSTGTAIIGGTINNTVIGGTTRAAGNFTTLDANGNVVLGDASSDTISTNGRFNTDLVPSTTNARDLGTSSLQWKQVYATTFTEGVFPVMSQTDIGTAPNQIPLNQYLGNVAFMSSNQLVINPAATAVPAGIGDMVFELASNTSLVVKVRGSDGTVRSATLTLA